MPGRGRSARSPRRKQWLNGLEDVRGDDIAGTLSVNLQPALRPRLLLIARAHPRQQREVPLVLVAIGRLAAGGRLGCDIEEDREIGRGEVLLRLPEPGSVEPVRLAVRDAGRQVADRKSVV